MRHRCERIVGATVIAAALLGGCVGPARAPAAPTPRTLAGTYELAVCRGAPCLPSDSATAYASFTVAIYDSLAAAQIDMPRTRYEVAPATGCFVRGHRRAVAPDSYAGIAIREYFVWKSDSAGSVLFPLFQSPDAGYVVRLRPTAAGLAGTGTSYGFDFGGPPPAYPRDTVVAVRVGPPDRLYCHTRRSR
jgi:hypothetical protein